MAKVQIAVTDRNYSRSLADLLQRDGNHQVYVVDLPLPRMDGVIVLDQQAFQGLGHHGPDLERYIVVGCDDRTGLSELWNAGIRHVAFANNPPAVAQLAILAIETGLSEQRPRPLACNGHSDSPRR